jgi:hypothetical protein
MPPIVEVPLVLVAILGAIQFGVWISILQEVAKLDPGKVRDIYKFNSRIARALLGINRKGARILLNGIEVYKSPGLTFRVRVLRILSTASGIILFGMLLAIGWLFVRSGSHS